MSTSHLSPRQSHNVHRWRFESVRISVQIMLVKHSRGREQGMARIWMNLPLLTNNLPHPSVNSIVTLSLENNENQAKYHLCSSQLSIFIYYRLIRRDESRVPAVKIQAHADNVPADNGRWTWGKLIRHSSPYIASSSTKWTYKQCTLYRCRDIKYRQHGDIKQKYKL